MCIITVVAAVGHVDDINKGKKGEIRSKVNRQHGDGAINTLTYIFLSFNTFMFYYQNYFYCCMVEVSQLSSFLHIFFLPESMTF